MKKLLVFILLIAVAWFGWRWWRDRGRAKQSGPEGRHAWVVSEKVLPADLMFVASTDFRKAGPLLRKAMTGIGGEFDDLVQNAAYVEKTCGVDPWSALDSGVAASEKDGYVVVFALAGKTRGDVDDCMRALAKAAGREAKITERDGATIYDGPFTKSWALLWLGDDVFVTGLGDEGFADPAYLKRMTSGGLATDKTFAKLGAVVPADAGFALRLRKIPLEVKGDYPSVWAFGVRGSNFVIDSRTYAANNDDLKSVKDELEMMIELGKHYFGETELAKLAIILDAMKVEQKSDHVAVTATVPFSDLAAALLPHLR